MAATDPALPFGGMRRHFPQPGPGAVFSGACRTVSLPMLSTVSSSTGLSPHGCRVHRALPQSPRDRGFRVVVVNPRQCRDLPRASGAPGRTDRVDARVPAAFGAAFPDMAATAPADVTVDRLRDMPVLREAPVDRRTDLKAVPGEVADPDPDGPVPRVLAGLDAAVRGYDRRTGEPVRGSESLAESYRILTSVPGIGPVTAASPSPGRSGRARSAP